jgi:hypothetical protein
MTTTSTPEKSFTTTLLVDQSPEEVVAAVTDPRRWWSENIEGATDIPGEEVTYRHKDIHRCTIRVTEMTSLTQVVWQVVNNYFAFTDDTTEWNGTEIARHALKTELRFTHLGLVPAYECFDVCSNSWDFYLRTSLRGLIRTGKGVPNPVELTAG